MEQNNLISFANVKASLFDPEVLTLLAPSVYNPTPERLKHRAEEYAADSNVKAYACNNSEKYIGIVVFVTENGTTEILDIAVKPEYRKHGIGRKLIDFIFNRFPVDTIIAETDDETVGFYKRYGFAVTPTKEFSDIRRYFCKLSAVSKHYDMLIDENNDPVRDPEPLREYMDKWDGQQFIDSLQLTKRKSVLEIGVGTGRLAVRTAPNCREFFGIDISQKTVKRAKENLKKQTNVTLVCGDFMSYEFGCKFDVIYSSLTFMHIKDKQAAINKVKTLLNISGRFVLSIDKIQSDTIEYGTRKIKIHPDRKEDIAEYINQSGMSLIKVFETEFAEIFAAAKQN
jgi:SAM-dependent methyltransferase